LMALYYERPPKDPEQREAIDVERNEAMAVLRRGLTRRFVVLVAFILFMIFAGQCTVVTMPNQYKVIRQFGEIVGVRAQPGLSFKLPFIQSVTSLPNNIRFYDIDISEVITKDKQTMVTDSFVLWRIIDPTTFIRTTAGSISEAERNISGISYNSLKNVISGLPLTDIISGRDTLATKITDNIGTALDPFGVDLIAIETKHLDLPDENKQAVYTRMISERNNIAASYSAEGEEEARKIRNTTDKQVAITIAEANAAAAATLAEGEQQYMQILAEAYNSEDKAEFYAYTRALEAAQKAYAGGDKTLILSPDSLIAQVFFEGADNGADAEGGAAGD